MQHFLSILSQPDNLPIAAMVATLAFLIRLWWRQAREHDRLTDEGRADEIGRSMRR